MIWKKTYRRFLSRQKVPPGTRGRFPAGARPGIEEDAHREVSASKERVRQNGIGHGQRGFADGNTAEATGGAGSSECGCCAGRAGSNLDSEHIGV